MFEPDRRELDLLRNDLMIFGTAIHTKTVRSQWNPFRYIFGKYKIKRIHPFDMIIETRNPNN